MKINKDLIKALHDLKTDATDATYLYELILQSQLYSIVRMGTENDIKKAEFLNYPSIDGVLELPLFTRLELALNFAKKFSSDDNIIFSYSCIPMWKQLYDLIKDSKCQVAIDPGENYGIRLNASMILGMLGD